jgi:hypothetical protein
MSKPEPQTAADIAWIRLVHAARDWANHMDQWERFKFTTNYGPVYVSVDRSVPYPDSFDVVDTLTGNVVKQAGIPNA